VGSFASLDGHIRGEGRIKRFSAISALLTFEICADREEYPARCRCALAVHLAHEVGEVAERSDAGEGRPARHPHPALRADLSHFVGEVYDDDALVWLRPIGCAVLNRWLVAA